MEKKMEKEIYFQKIIHFIMKEIGKMIKKKEWEN